MFWPGRNGPLTVKLAIDRFEPVAIIWLASFASVIVTRSTTSDDEGETWMMGGRVSHVERLDIC